MNLVGNKTFINQDLSMTDPMTDIAAKFIKKTSRRRPKNEVLVPICDHFSFPNYIQLTCSHNYNNFSM